MDDMETNVLQTQRDVDLKGEITFKKLTLLKDIKIVLHCQDLRDNVQLVNLNPEFIGARIVR